MLQDGACFFLYPKALTRSYSQTYLILAPVLALTLYSLKGYFAYKFLRDFSAEGVSSSLRSLLFPKRIIGTQGSRFSRSSFSQNCKLYADLSSVSEKAKKIPSEFRKKFFAIDLNLSCPVVSHSSTSTYSPWTFLFCSLQSTPTVPVMPCLKQPQMMRTIIDVFPTEESPTMQVFSFLPINYKSIALQFYISLSFIGMATSNSKGKQKQRAKFYELTKLEKEAGQIQDIYRRIDMQQKYMEDLLMKYNIGAEETDAPSRVKDKERSSTLEVRSDYTSVFTQRERKKDKLTILPVQLPMISSRRSIRRSRKKVAKQRSQRKDSISNSINAPPIETSNQEERENLKSVLKKAYLNQKPSLHQQKGYKKSEATRIANTQSPQTLNGYESTRTRVQSGRLSDHLLQLDKLRQQQNLQPGGLGQKQKQIPLPMGYFSRPEDSEESSEEDNVPLAYYEKEYRGMIRAQCLQETNFLYFSKNQSMHNWTQGLLLLFQKHDKELAGLRKRCKYLQKFDGTFFSIDIFKND